MFSLPLITLFVATAGLIWWLNKDNGTRKGFKKIPGPRGIPILGNILQIGQLMHIKFGEWAEKYGDIFQVWLGSTRAIVISDPKMMKDIFTNDPAFAGRSFFEGFEMYPNEKLGIVVSEGELWEVHRRFLLRQLRDFGFGKSTMEQLIAEEVQQTLAQLKQLSKDNKSISSIKEILLVSVINSLWSVVAGKRFEPNDPKLVKIMKDANEITEELMKRAIFFLIPWTRRFLPEPKVLAAALVRNRELHKEIVDEHKATFKEGQLRDFIDVYLAEMEANKNNPSSLFHGIQAEKNLHAIMGDLHAAGSDTSSTTLSWAILYLCKYKHVQEKLKQEITSITGDLRTVSLDDRPNMPYTLAVLDETMRRSSIVPTGVQHRAMADREFNGYFIPKDTQIFPNLHYLHHNPRIWGDPLNFRPERFLTPDGLKYKKNENLMPFQVGRRQCVGETLARDTLFLFLTNMFQKFTFSLDPSLPEPTLEPKVNFALFPQDYSIKLKERNNL